jgi:hypothetical protein
MRLSAARAGTKKRTPMLMMVMIAAAAYAASLPPALPLN